MANGLAYQVLMGAGKLYTGTFSLTAANEPALSAINTTPQASAWTYAGLTNDGVTITMNQEFAEMTVDQLADTIGRKMVTRDVQVQANLAEATLENLILGLNSGTVTTGSGYKYYEPEYDGDELQPTYFAVLFDAYAPSTSAGATRRRRFLLRKVLQIENVETAYKKDEMTLIPVTFACHYVSDTVAPFRIIDET